MRSGDDVAVRALDGTVLYTGTFPGLRAARIDARVLLVLTRVGTQSSLWTVDLSSGQRSGTRSSSTGTTRAAAIPR